MTTLIDYLLETQIMSRDALKQAMRDFDKRQMGKSDGSKPSKKRTAQMDKRKSRKAGYSEEEEQMTKNGRGRPKTPEMLKRQSDAGQPRDEKLKRGRPKTPEMLKRQSGL